MAYSLESMLKIRAMREDRAGTELTGARRAKTAAERVLRRPTRGRASRRQRNLVGIGSIRL